MKRLDDGKVSLVEFLRSIKFSPPPVTDKPATCPTHFAGLRSQSPAGNPNNTEEAQLVRSAN